ncbi:MAG: monooxygenase [Microbacteriaceae bacterium]|nr:monooxygenase [Microbacteriaceae bacterium]
MPERSVYEERRIDEERSVAEPRSVDVLVIGAGPTGLAMANCLARLGVSAMIVDAKSGPTRESRALAVQARTMEVYDQLGLAPAMLEELYYAEAIIPGYERTVFRPVALGALGRGITPFPRVHVLEQSRTETILARALEEGGNAVAWNHRLTALEVASPDDQGRPVSVRFDSPDGPVDVRARYCVGADGASSAVRTTLGIAFEGVTNAHTFYVADGLGVRGLSPGHINVRFGARDFLLTFPMGPGGHDRLLGIVRHDDEQTTTSEPAWTPRADPEVVERRVRTTLHDIFAVDYDATAWFATYRVHHRSAVHFRQGPVFLVGDAAHVHSPVGGQGMNTGIQDAHNLACKLADVLAGRATDGYLDRFEAERRPVALRLVSTTDRAFLAVTSDHPLARFLRRRLLPIVATLGTRIVPRLRAASRLFGYVSQTRIHYWMSDEERDLSGGHRGAIVGRRLPWTGENYDCLRSMTWQVHTYARSAAAAARSTAAALGIECHVFESAGATGLGSEEMFLVRPDGFVAAAASGRSATAVFRAALRH